MKIDSHQHFWKYNVNEYTWISCCMEELKQDHLPADLKPLLRKNGIGGTITVQARQCIEETEWLLQLADDNAFIKGVVGWLPLIDERIEQLLEIFASNAKLKGLRHVIQDEPNEKFILQEDFIRGVDKLRKHHLTYDILVFPIHTKHVAKFVKKLPDQLFVIDHLAKPYIKDRIFEPWKTDMKQLASFENVYCKISGMVTEALWNNWTFGHFTPYLDTVLDFFGTERLMFGSDWPVCTLAAEYEQVLEIVYDFIFKLSPNEQEKIMGQNASNFYGLEI